MVDLCFDSRAKVGSHYILYWYGTCVTPNPESRQVDPLRRKPLLTTIRHRDFAMHPRKLHRFMRRLDWMQGAAVAAFVVYVSALALVT